MKIEIRTDWFKEKWAKVSTEDKNFFMKGILIAILMCLFMLAVGGMAGGYAGIIIILKVILIVLTVVVIVTTGGHFIQKLFKKIDEKY